MKILIIGFSKIKYMPYVNFYLDNIDLSKNEVHLIFWNKDRKDDVIPKKDVFLHEFSLMQCDAAPKFSKLGNFLKFRRFTLSVMKKFDFDRVIVFHSVPMLLFFDKLLTKYKNRYIFDYRDVTYERFLPFKKAVICAAKNARAVFLSSEAFYEIIPKSEKTHIIHNLLFDSVSKRLEFEKKQEPVNISFWGFVRQSDFNLKIVKALKNDGRFVLNYYGASYDTSDALKGYCKKNGVKNVRFFGEYKPDERYEFAKNAALIHNMYQNDATKYAMGNKFYDGLVFRLPLVCTKGSFMGETAEKYGVGIALDPDDPDFADKIYNYYTSLDEKSFSENCDAALRKILDEYNDAANAVKEACR